MRIWLTQPCESQEQPSRLGTRIELREERFQAVRREPERNRTFQSLGRQHSFLYQIFQHSPCGAFGKAGDSGCLSSFGFPGDKSLIEEPSRFRFQGLVLGHQHSETIRQTPEIE